MKITRDKEVVELRFCAANCTGYRADKIEITREDVRAMRQLAKRDPEEFQRALLQLECRWS